MKILFFDTETTGFVGDIIQMGALFVHYDETNKTHKVERIIDQLINTDQEISEGAFQCNWLTKEMITPFGKMQDYIQEFLWYMNKADLIVCHNVKFDMWRFNYELEKAGIGDVLYMKKTYCTMNSEQTKAYMGSSKWPKLKDLYFKCFNKDFDNAHNALADVEATKDCFMYLLNEWVITLY